MSEWLRGLWARWISRGAADGCCTCGGPHADYFYFGAMEGTNQSSPDWAQCARCHNGADDHAAWMRTLRWQARV